MDAVALLQIDKLRFNFVCVACCLSTGSNKSKSKSLGREILLKVDEADCSEVFRALSSLLPLRRWLPL